MENKRNYIPYHLHDDTSNVNGYADSCTKYEEYIELAKKCNMKAIAFSNHGGMYDWIKKKQCCDKNNIKYIHGVELYLCNNLSDNNRGWHIGLYAKNLDGVKELNSLVSISTSKGKLEDKSDRHFYFNPRISVKELMNTSDNIIITTACLASPLWKLGNRDVLELENGEEIYKNNLLLRSSLLEWFSNNRHRVFLEIQYHNCDHQKEYNQMLLRWSKEYKIPLIAGTDTHSSNKYKAECRKVLQKSKNSFYGEEDEFDLTWKTYDELVEAFKIQGALPYDEYIAAIENTNKLANMVEDFNIDKKFKYPNLYGETETIQWKQFIADKMQEKLMCGAIDIKRFKEYKDKINEEFEAMSKQGMASFMLFMGELSNWCIKEKIYFSPCRGSVGGSLIAYVTGITDVDPMKWHTVFSRFCNADRISLADIDMDFAPCDREKVYKYIIDRFGLDKVSYILTLGTIKDRGSIDVLAKGLEYNDLGLVKDIKNKFDSIFDNYKKIIQAEVNLEELEGAESKSPDFIDHELYVNTIRNESSVQKIIELKEEWDKLRNDNKDLFYYFDGIKGTIISKGNHPAGIIGSPITLYDNLGVVYKDGDENFPVSFCTMKAVDSVNYVKFDILGLKTIGIIQDTYKLINKEWKFAHQINWNDSNVWNDMIKSNVGIFQFEGLYAHDLLKKFKPKAINDMSLVNASLRPSGKSYRDRLINHEFNNNPSKEIDDLLKDNKGFLVFQEDTIKFLTDICGFSGSLADTTRRAIGKKDIDLLNEQLPKILEGYCNTSNKPREIAEEEAKKFIQIISDSSEYQFGLNHSTGYSMNGYTCSMLRCYYPLEFTTSYLNWAENEEDIINGKQLAQDYNIKINPPKFRYSKAKYHPNKETNSIYKGIGSIKYCNEKIGDELYSLRENTYESFLILLIDINNKTSLNSRQLDILIKLGFFSEFGGSKMLLEIVDIYNKIATKKQFKKDKLEELGLTEEIVKMYAKKETEKQFTQVDTVGLVEYMASKLEDKDISIREIFEAEMEYVGYISYKDSSYNKKVCVISNIEENRWGTIFATLYCLKTGKSLTLKVDKRYYNSKPLEQYDVIMIGEIVQKFKKKRVEGKWINTEEKEYILKSYGRVVEDE